MELNEYSPFMKLSYSADLSYNLSLIKPHVNPVDQYIFIKVTLNF